MIRDPSQMRTRVALLGAGRWGRRLLPALRQRFDVPVACTTGGAAGVEWLREQGVEPVALEQALADETIDAVAIATPIETHAELVARALDAGKHVFVEKPLATSSVEARDLAARGGPVLFVGHVYLYHPLLDELRAEPLRSARLMWRKYGTFDSDLYWNLASHDVSTVIALFGERPERVEVPLAGRDATRIELGFAAGRNAVIEIDRMAQERVKIVHATTESGAELSLDFDVAEPRSLDRELDAFADAVERGDPFPSDAAHAVAVVEIVERIREAAS
jgi:predicted dehydrogenase